MAKDVSLEIITKTTDKKIFERYGGSFAEAVGISYRVTTAETWEDLDATHARGLMDSGLATLREEHIASHQPAPADPSDPESRIYCTTLCLLAQHPAFSELLGYLFSRNAAERLASVDDLFLQLNAVAANVKRRHAEAFGSGNLRSWLVGRSLGVLAVIGEPSLA
jgi:hypothetical protein